MTASSSKWGHDTTEIQPVEIQTSFGPLNALLLSNIPEGKDILIRRQDGRLWAVEPSGAADISGIQDRLAALETVATSHTERLNEHDTRLDEHNDALIEINTNLELDLIL